MIKETRYEIEVYTQVKDTGDRDEKPVKSGICGYVLFQPLGRPLRSRFVPGLLSEFDKGVELKKFCALGDIPGEHIYCDLSKGVWGTFDPLYKPEQLSEIERLVEKMQEVMTATSLGGNKVKFKRPHEQKLDDADTAKDVMYWMARMIENKMAVNVSGYSQMPSLDEIKRMVGKRNIDPHNMHQWAPKEFKDKIEPYAFEVEAPASARAATESQ